MTARRWWTAAGAAACVLAIIIVAVVLRQPPASTAASSAPATTTVARGTLVDVQTFPGQLAYGPELLAESRLSGTVTAIPDVGTTIDRGRALFRIDDKPVILMYGSIPAYRTLTAGHAGHPATSGADVREFETNLAALGYTGFSVGTAYSASVAAAVRHWQRDVGVAQTGDVELGRVYYTSGPIRVARQKLTPGAVAGGPILSYTSTSRLVTATLQAHNQALATLGAHVTIALANGKDVDGTVISVGTPSDDQTAADQEPTLDVVASLDDPTAVDGLDDGPARVSFVAQERKNVLYVPVGALLALAEGGYGLQIIDGDRTRIVAVTTGLFAAGNVEITGGDITAGMTVGMAR